MHLEGLMRRTCLNEVYNLAKIDKRIFFIGSDLGFETLKQFRDEMPDRFLMEGINEGHVIGMASGLALENKIVYVNTIATFLTRRCFEQIVLDMCMHNVNVRLIGNGGGLVYAPLGSTHLAFEDIAILRAIPNMTIVAPADANEMRRLMPLTVDYKGPLYIRLAKGYDPIVTNDNMLFDIGRGFEMRSGRDALILTTGVTLKYAQQASLKLSEYGIETSIIHLPTIKPLDTEMILDRLSEVKAVVTVEEHTIVGGLGSAVAELIAESNYNHLVKFKRIGIPDVFPDQYGSQDSLMERYRICDSEIIRTIRNLLE